MWTLELAPEWSPLDWESTPARSLQPNQLRMPLNLSLAPRNSFWNSRDGTPVKSGQSASQKTSTPKLMSNVWREVKLLADKMHRVAHSAHLVQADEGGVRI